MVAATAVMMLARPGLAQTDDAPALGGIHAITREEPRIRALLEQSGWVSPGLSKTRYVYMLSFRSCSDCIRYERQEFPALHKAGIDTRVMLVARRERSTAPERTTVAELWAHRRWKTFQQWTETPIGSWTADGLPSADSDPARAALVEQSRQLAEKLEPLLAYNGIQLAYPTLIWEGPDGHLQGCACEGAPTYPAIRKALGVPQD